MPQRYHLLRIRDSCRPLSVIIKYSLFIKELQKDLLRYLKAENSYNVLNYVDCIQYLFSIEKFGND